MSDATELAAIEAAITQALTAQKWKHGNDEAELPDIDKLYARKREIEGRISRRGRGMRATGVSIRHN